MKAQLQRCLLALLIAVPASETAAPKVRRLNWQPWSDAVFAQANQEKRFVLLDLEAVWCHWCHVIDENTYSDPAVIKMLQSHYIVVKADQDARPDLSNRYEDYGWPATVVFDAAGHEIVKRQGYLAPDEMLSMLEAIVDNPTPGPSVRPEAKLELPANPLLSDALRQQLRKSFLGRYDQVHGSWGTEQKLLDWDSVEYALDRARLNGDTQAEHMARHTLTEQLHLLDPAWGGVYQYSSDGDWKSPHFEKIMQMQAENLRIYSLAYAQLGDSAYLHAAQEIRRYLKTFLTSPQGAFYTSQDADLIDGQHSAEYFALGDAARRKGGVPRIDKRIYARENGWAISGFVALYGATGDLPWLSNAESAMKFIDANFRDATGAGFLTTKIPAGPAYVPHAQRDENVMVARTATLLFHYTGDTHDDELARQAMRYLAAVPVVNRLPAASALLADLEISRPPLHLTIVGHKSDPAAQRLFQAALRYPGSYKRLEWWDVAEGQLRNADVQYPELNSAAAFICTNRAYSPPIFNPADLVARVDKLSGLEAWH